MENKKKLLKSIQQYEKNLMLNLKDSEREKLLEEFTSILNSFEKYDSIDLSNVEPTHFPITSNSQLREDIVIESKVKKEILKVSSNFSNGFIGIKNVK